MDADNYPTDDELQKIREWPYTDVAGVMAFLRERWQYADVGYWQETPWTPSEFGGGERRQFHLHTAGWSGNESLIHALHDNVMMMALHWVQSRRGGHYVFEEHRKAEIRP